MARRQDARQQRKTARKTAGTKYLHFRELVSLHGSSLDVAICDSHDGSASRRECEGLPCGTPRTGGDKALVGAHFRENALKLRQSRGAASLLRVLHAEVFQISPQTTTQDE
jgi:hypothetical protein